MLVGMCRLRFAPRAGAPSACLRGKGRVPSVTGSPRHPLGKSAACQAPARLWVVARARLGHRKSIAGNRKAVSPDGLLQPSPAKDAPFSRARLSQRSPRHARPRGLSSPGGVGSWWARRCLQTPCPGEAAGAFGIPFGRWPWIPWTSPAALGQGKPLPPRQGRSGFIPAGFVAPLVAVGACHVAP